MGIAFQPIFANLDGFWWDGFDTIIVCSLRAYFFLFFSFLFLNGQDLTYYTEKSDRRTKSCGESKLMLADPEAGPQMERVMSDVMFDDVRCQDGWWRHTQGLTSNVLPIPLTFDTRGYPKTINKSPKSSETMLSLQFPVLIAFMRLYLYLIHS